MERRKLLKFMGGIGATSVLGIGGIAAFSSGAAASSSGLTINDANVTEDDGDVSKVGVFLNHSASWDGFDEPVHAVEYRDVLRVYDNSGNQLGSHVLRDGLNTPVLLENISTQGNSGDGWGGDGEYADVDAADEDEDDSHAEAGYLAGSVYADIDWTLIADPTAQNVNTPPQGSVADTSTFGIDNETDDSTAKYTIELKKIVQFYTRDSSGGYQTDNGKSVALMGGDDGTVSKTEASGQFTLSVTNDPSTQSSSGTGSSNAS